MNINLKVDQKKYAIETSDSDCTGNSIMPQELLYADKIGVGTANGETGGTDGGAVHFDTEINSTQHSYDVISDAPADFNLHTVLNKELGRVAGLPPVTNIFIFANHA